MRAHGKAAQRDASALEKRRDKHGVWSQTQGAAADAQRATPSDSGRAAKQDRSMALSRLHNLTNPAPVVSIGAEVDVGAEAMASAAKVAEAAEVDGAAGWQKQQRSMEQQQHTSSTSNTSNTIGAVVDVGAEAMASAAKVAEQ